MNFNFDIENRIIPKDLTIINKAYVLGKQPILYFIGNDIIAWNSGVGHRLHEESWKKLLKYEF